MWKHRAWYTAVLLAALMIYIVADRREALVFFCALFLVPVVCLVIQAEAVRSFQEDFRVKEGCRAGQEMDVVFHFRRRSRLPSGSVRIHLVSENVLYGTREDWVVSLQPAEKKEMEFHYPLRMENCGNVKFSVLFAECNDLLGLFCFKKKVDLTAETLVYPPLIRLDVELGRRPETKSSGEFYAQQKKGQDVSEVSGLRDYVPGDSQKSIHWKLSGKLGELIVREFGYPSDYNTLILYEAAKNLDGQEIDNRRNDMVMALVVSLSQGMMELNLEHDVGRVLSGQYQATPVYSFDTHEQMTLNLLYGPAGEEQSSSDTIYHFLRGNLKNQYTKIVYVAPLYDEESIRQLAREIDLTVICAARDGQQGYVENEGYSAIFVNADQYQGNMYHIVI